MSTTTLRTLLLALLPAVGFAQAAPRIYVGASALLPVDFRSIYPISQTRPSFSVGLQLSARWALELDPQLYWHNDQGSYSYVSNGDVYLSSGEDHYGGLSLPLLARLTLTRPGGRWQVDALGGASWLHGWGHSQSSSTINGQPTYSSDYRYSSNGAALVLGPQLRYAFGPALAAKFSVPLNFRLMGEGTFSDHFYLTPQLGVQYAFAR